MKTYGKSPCFQCPRKCGADRENARGRCGESLLPSVAKVMLHKWEEPCVSGKNGAGTVFFSGCSLRCVYCQNAKIIVGAGDRLTPSELSRVFLELQERGAECIDLVTPTHFSGGIISALDEAKGKLHIPVVWNTSGYETVENVRLLKGKVDVFLTDFKYFSSALSARYSDAPDYRDVAVAALKEMVALTGKPVIENGIIKRGVIVRHLVLPGVYRDSIEVLRLVAKTVGAKNVLFSLMVQYTPDFVADRENYPELCRKVTTYEYQKAADECRRLGFEGYFQERLSAVSDYTPVFL